MMQCGPQHSVSLNYKLNKEYDMDSGLYPQYRVIRKLPLLTMLCGPQHKVSLNDKLNEEFNMDSGLYRQGYHEALLAYDAVRAKELGKFK